MKTLALLLASCILAGTVHAVDVTKAEAATKIKSLPATISAPGYYYLAPNINQLFPAATVPAITITSSNVVLDLNGINIVAFNGILIAPTKERAASFVVIQNGTITAPSITLSPTAGPFAAISLLGMSAGCTIDAVNIVSGGPTPVVAIQDAGNANTIKNCWLVSNASVLVLQSSIVTNNVINVSTGASIQSSGLSVFRNNTFVGAGVVIAFSVSDELIGNAFEGLEHTGGVNIASQ